MHMCPNYLAYQKHFDLMLWIKLYAKEDLLVYEQYRDKYSFHCQSDLIN